MHIVADLEGNQALREEGHSPVNNKLQQASRGLLKLVKQS